MSIRASCKLALPPPAAGSVDLLIVVLNYKTPDLTIQCLESLAKQQGPAPAPRISVVVADNASGDGSAEKIGAAIAERGWSGWAKCVENGKNGGFAWGNNRGTEAGPHARYVLLLNSDTIVGEGCMRACVEAMDRAPRVGVMITRLVNVDGTNQNVCRRFPTPARMFLGALCLPWKFPKLFGWADTEDGGWDRTRERRSVDWVAGAFMFIRREVLEQVGGLDEDFFFYGEDLEFCHRVHRAGWERVYDPVGTVVHIGGASSDPARLSSRNRLFMLARYMVQQKCYGWPAAAFARLVDVTTVATRMAYYVVRRRRDKWSEERDRLVMITRRLQTA